MLAYFAVHDHRFLVLVHKLDRILDGDDVLRAGVVDVVDHRRKRGRLAAAGGAGDEDEALVELAELLQCLRKLQGVEREDIHGDLAEDGRHAPVIV